MSTMGAQLGEWLLTGADRRSEAPPAVDTPEAVLSALVEQYSGALYRVAYSVTRHRAEAEDAVQETFLRVWKNRDKLPAIRDARVWLVRITWNVVLDKKRRAKVRPETDDVDEVARTLPSGALNAEREAMASEGYRRLLDAIDRLPRKERECVLLSAVEEWTTAEIAAVMNTTESSVRSRLFRARKLLAPLVAGAGGKKGRA
jgi:RNA polymerase sigma-70 factor, ECF subfamily